MASSIILAFYFYEKTLVPNRSRPKGKNRGSKYYPRKFEENHQPLEPWDQVEQRLVAEGNLAASEARYRSASQTVEL
jgi:hypothetical protein